MYYYGERIRKARLVAGLLVTDLATLIGVNPQTIRRWECGARAPSHDAFIALAEACNTTMAYLLGDEAFDEPFRRFTGEIPIRYHDGTRGKTRGGPT